MISFSFSPSNHLAFRYRASVLFLRSTVVSLVVSNLSNIELKAISECITDFSIVTIDEYVHI